MPTWYEILSDESADLISYSSVKWQAKSW